MLAPPINKQDLAALKVTTQTHNYSDNDHFNEMAFDWVIRIKGYVYEPPDNLDAEDLKASYPFIRGPRTPYEIYWCPSICP